MIEDNYLLYEFNIQYQNDKRNQLHNVDHIMLFKMFMEDKSSQAHKVLPLWLPFLVYRPFHRYMELKVKHLLILQFHKYVQVGILSTQGNLLSLFHTKMNQLGKLYKYYLQLLVDKSQLGK